LWGSRPLTCPHKQDHANAKSNHSHLGTIKSSNLCTEIYQYTDENHTAVCNLASLVLPAYFKKVGDVDGSFKLDRELLQRAVRRLVRNLNVVIDSNYYPTTESRASNTRTRPVGIGLQGFQDVLFQLGLPFDSPEARILNREVRQGLSSVYSTLSLSLSLCFNGAVHSPDRCLRSSTTRRFASRRRWRGPTARARRTRAAPRPKGV